MADWPRNASLAGHKHVRKKNEQAEVRNEASDSQTIAMEITLMSAFARYPMRATCQRFVVTRQECNVPQQRFLKAIPFLSIES